MKSIEKEYKKYWESPKRLNYIIAMKISSVEVAFRRTDVVNKNIFFEKLLGVGAEIFL